MRKKTGVRKVIRIKRSEMRNDNIKERKGKTKTKRDEKKRKI